MSTLAERLGRSGAKTTTLDFEDRAEFLERRGFESARTLAVVREVWERQRAWIGEQRERLSELWERAGVALRAVRERWAGRTLEAEFAVPQTVPARASSAAELARASALSSPDYRHAAAVTRFAAARVYRISRGPRVRSKRRSGRGALGRIRPGDGFRPTRRSSACCGIARIGRMSSPS